MMMILPGSYCVEDGATTKWALESINKSTSDYVELARNNVAIVCVQNVS